MKNRLCIDFDRTIYPYNGWGDGSLKGYPLPGAKYALQRLHELGYFITIYSCRTNKYELDARGQKMKMEDWLNEHEIYFDEIYASEGKPIADMYIDDKAFRLVDWNKDLSSIINLLDHKSYIDTYCPPPINTIFEEDGA